MRKRFCILILQSFISISIPKDDDTQHGCPSKIASVVDLLCDSSFLMFLDLPIEILNSTDEKNLLLCDTDKVVFLKKHSRKYETRRMKDTGRR